MLKLSGTIFFIMIAALGYMLFQGQKPAETTLVEIQESPAPGIDIRACEQDSDCIPIAEQCCDCNQGGRQTAMNRKYYRYGLDQRADSCMLTSCPNAISTHESCTSTKATCVNGQCQMK